MKKFACNKIRGMAGDYFQNLLASDLASMVEFHLTECSSCRKEYAETREVLTLLKGDKLTEPTPEFWTGLSSRIMAQIRLHRPQTKEIPWYKKVWENPFGWPGYAWATALILLLLTPATIYTVHVNGQKTQSIQGIPVDELKWAMGLEFLPSAVRSLSDKESVHLAKKIVAQLGKDLPRHQGLLVENEVHWDISRSLEGLNNEELEAMIKKMQTGGSVGFKEEEEYVC